LKKSTRRRVKKGLAIRAAALTILTMMLLAFGLGVYTFQDFIFIYHPGEDKPSTYAMSALADDKEPPALTRQTHRETPDTIHNPRTVAETYGYTLLPRTLSDNLSEAEKTLKTYKIPYSVEYVLAKEPESELLWIEYAGFSDGNGYYVNPEVEITLCVSGNKPIQAAFNGTNRIYLTFDDGPSQYTADILDTLSYYGVKATFFTLGTSIEKYPAIAADIVNRGHILACHSYSHKYNYIYASTDNLIEEVRQWEFLLQKLELWNSAKNNLYFRFPSGSVNSYTSVYLRNSMIDAMHNRGYRIFDWNIVTNDSLLSIKPADTDSYTYMQTEFLASLAMRASASDKILLLHDQVEETATLLPWLIQYLLDNGYCFGTLDQLETEYFMG